MKINVGMTRFSRDAESEAEVLTVRLPRPKLEPNLKPSYLFEYTGRKTKNGQKEELAGAFSPQK